MKMIIVMRKDLNMRKGKLIAQGSHAVTAVLLNTMQCGYGIWHHTKVIEQWLNTSFRKICVYVNSEEELLDIVNQSRLANIPCELITDNGLTEFNGVPTNTCCAIGPWMDEELDLITGGLPLL